MGLITYNPGESKFDVPPGTYLTRFIGCVDKEPFQDSRFAKPGRPPEPRLGWQFEVVTPGASLGKIIEQNTGTFPSSKSGLVRLLNMLLANQGGLQPGQSVDPQSFVGHVYQIQWLPNPSSEKGNPYIAGLMEMGADASTTPPPRTVTAPVVPGQPAPAPQPAGLDPRLPVQSPPPPARPRSAPPRPAAPPKRYFVDDPEAGEGDMHPMTREQVQTWIDGNKALAKNVMVCEEGSQAWTQADILGFRDCNPF